LADRIKYQHTDRENEAALLWESICGESRIDRFHEKIVPHEKSTLFGYADVTIVVATAFGVTCPIKLRGLVVKSLKGKAHIDMPAEKGSDGDYYDQFMPRSAALRTVLTTLIVADPEVQATVQRASTAPAASAQPTAAPVAAAAGASATPSFSSGNPFRS